METEVIVRDDLPPRNLEEFIRWVEEVKNEIPKEYWSTTDIKIDGEISYDVAYARCVVSYSREETAEEKRQREASVRVEKLLDETRQRQEYERLKKKFEPTK